MQYYLSMYLYNLVQTSNRQQPVPLNCYTGTMIKRRRYSLTHTIMVRQLILFLDLYLSDSKRQKDRVPYAFLPIYCLLYPYACCTKLHDEAQMAFYSRHMGNLHQIIGILTQVTVQNASQPVCGES
jgi:hypothetical protein